MNPTYSSPRNHTSPFLNGHVPPFYNPQQKESNSSSLANPVNKHQGTYGHTAMQGGSKSYLAKNNFEHTKNTNNSSAYLKSSGEGNNSSAGFSSYTPSYGKNSGEMVKSSFYEQPKVSEAPTTFPRAG